MYIECIWRSEKSVEFPGAGIRDDCKSPVGTWNLWSSAGGPELLNTEPSLQPRAWVIFLQSQTCMHCRIHSLIRIFFRRNKACPLNGMHLNLWNSFIHSKPKLGTNQKSISWRVCKLKVAYPHVSSERQDSSEALEVTVCLSCRVKLHLTQQLKTSRTCLLTCVDQSFGQARLGFLQDCNTNASRGSALMWTGRGATYKIIQLVGRIYFSYPWTEDVVPRSLLAGGSSQLLEAILAPEATLSSLRSLSG